MSRCAALDRDWIKTKEVIPWTAVASTGPTSGNSSRVRWFAITPSIRNFVEPGSAKPAARLMTISTRLVASNPRRGRAGTRNSGGAAQRLVGLAASAAGFPPPAGPNPLMMRSGCGSLPSDCKPVAQFAGVVRPSEIGLDCREALQIGKLPLLAMSLSMSGTAAALSLSSTQPLG
jgi:hypothetical protein